LQLGRDRDQAWTNRQQRESAVPELNGQQGDAKENKADRRIGFDHGLTGLELDQFIDLEKPPEEHERAAYNQNHREAE
jgi:hypothetical protein